MRKKTVLSCCSSAVTEARFQHIVLHIVRYLQFQCAWELSCLAPPCSCLAQTKTAFKFQRSLLPSQHVTEERKQVRVVCSELFWFERHPQRQQDIEIEWLQFLMSLRNSRFNVCVAHGLLVLSISFQALLFLEITSWPQWCDTCADCRPYEPVDTNYGGEPGTYGGRQVSWHQLFLKGIGTARKWRKNVRSQGTQCNHRY